jgi:LuxR family transcriptional regulator, maltose regulon positive regulatory protein
MQEPGLRTVTRGEGAGKLGCAAHCVREDRGPESVARRRGTRGVRVAEDVSAGHVTSQVARFAAAKFRPPALPVSLVTRSGLHDRLTAGAGKRLTVVVGSAGAGKTVLLSNWAAGRPPSATAWLSCEPADASPVRFWSAFIEAPRAAVAAFGSDAADLLAMDGAMSADVIASIVNDAAELPAGFAIVVDDFHLAAPMVSGDMADLVERWPDETAQLALGSRFDPPLRLDQWRMSGELCELRDRDLYFSLAESGELLARFGVHISAAQLANLHRGCEGWAAALQIAALSLRGNTDPARAAEAVALNRHAIAEYFAAEVLDHQPPEVARFMLDTSVLEELTAGACAAVSGEEDAAGLLRWIDAANLFLVALDDDRMTFRYHHLIHEVLRAELRARDRARELALQSRAGEWFESAGEIRRAARHFLAAGQADRALALIQDQLVTSFLGDPALPAPPDLSGVDPAALVQAPGRLLAVAGDLLLSGDALGAEYLDVLERAHPQIAPDSALAAQLAVTRALRHMLAGQAEQAVAQALAARAIRQRAHLEDAWSASVPMLLLRAYMLLEDFRAVEREAAALLAVPGLPEPVKRVMVPGARALAWFETGCLAEAAEAAGAAEEAAERLGFGRHFFAVDHLRTLAGLALEQRDLDTAERLTEQAISISERQRPFYEFLALLDRSRIWAARGQVRQALATVQAAGQVLAMPSPVLRARAEELQAELRLSLGDLRSAAELPAGLPAGRRALLLAKVALARGDGDAARDQLAAWDQLEPPGETTPRHALVRRLLQAAAAIERADPAAAGIVGGVLDTARHAGFLGTVVTTAPQLTSYLIEHAPQMFEDPFTDQLIAAALEVRATRPVISQPRRTLPEPLTPAEQRVLELLPTSTYSQMAATLNVSRNTVKTHLRSIYAKLGAASRAEAIERAVDLDLL